jgi:phytoene desaturase
MSAAAPAVVRSRPRVCVVGAGFAGLSAALLLASAGARVTVLERAATPGGKAGEWRAGGFRFDTGPTLLTLPDVVEATFAAAGQPCPLDLGHGDGATRYVFASGRSWDVSTDLDRTVAGLSSEEADAYRRALARARRLYEAAAPVFVHAPAPRLPARLAYALRSGAAASPRARLPQLLEALGVRGDLRTFFLRFATYFGADPFRAPAVLHNIAWVELGLGPRHVRGGMHALARALEAALVGLGGEVRYGCEVRAVSARAPAWEVVSDTGAEACAAVVLAIDRTQALGLLGRAPRREREPSLSGLVWLAGVRGVDARLARHTVLFPQEYEREFREIRSGVHPIDPTLYLSISARDDPEDAPAGHENRFVMANAPALPPRGADAAARSPGGDAGALPLHEAGRAALRDTLARRGFAPAGGVVVERWLTPTSYAAFGHRGSLYGAAPHGLLAALRPRNAVAGAPDLALAGGTVHPGGGVPLALLSGRFAAERIARHLGLSDAV